MGDEAWVPVSSLRSFGWRIRESGPTLNVEAEGRSLRLPTQDLNGVAHFNMSEAARQLGAISRWEDDLYRVLAEVRSLDFVGSSVRVNATLSFRVETMQLANPNRLVIDLVGATVGDISAFRAPQNVRIGKFRPDTLRIVVDDPNVSMPRTSRPGSTRWLDLSLAPYRFPELGPIEPPFNPETPVPTVSDLTPADTVPKPNSATILQPGPAPTLVDLVAASTRMVNNRTAVLDFRFGSDLRPAPTVSYENATTILLRLNAKLAQPLPKLESEFVSSVETQSTPAGPLEIRIRTKRALTFQLSANGALATLRLQAPSQSDGRIAGKTIVIDPGHGGPDSGATWPMRGRNPTVMEKTLVMAVSRFMADELNDLGANVILTRNSDVRIPLAERAAIANRNNADVFVSVHFNSSSAANRKSGTITFYHMREADGLLLARCIEDELAKVSGIPSHGAWSDSRIYATGFGVLRNSRVPSVLLELGFINHDRDRGNMVRPDWQRRMAEAVVRGIRVFLGDVKETSKP